MAVNKHALIRYKVLDKCFRNPYKRFFMDDLIELCSEALSDFYVESKTISRRQIFHDMEFMKSEAGYYAPIEGIYFGRKKFYRYEDLDFSIENIPLTKEELSALENFNQILGRVSGISGFEWFNEYQTKLTDATSEHQTPIISFDENEYLHGLEYLQDLYNYIKNHSSIHIKYQAFNSVEEIDIV